MNRQARQIFVKTPVIIQVLILEIRKIEETGCAGGGLFGGMYEKTGSAHVCPKCCSVISATHAVLLLQTNTCCTMKRLAALSLFLSFFVCYMEWPPDNSAFVGEMAYQILFQRDDHTDTLLHPMILLPFLGLLLVLYAALRKEPDKRVIFTAMALMGVLVLLLLAIGIMGGNAKIVLSTLPFIGASVWCFRVFKQNKT